VSSVQDFLRYNEMLEQSVTLSVGDGNFQAGDPTLSFGVSFRNLPPSDMTEKTPLSPSATGMYETTNIEPNLKTYYKN